MTPKASYEKLYLHLFTLFTRLTGGTTRHRQEGRITSLKQSLLTFLYGNFPPHMTQSVSPRHFALFGATGLRYQAQQSLKIYEETQASSKRRTAVAGTGTLPRHSLPAPVLAQPITQLRVACIVLSANLQRSLAGVLLSLCIHNSIH